MDTTREQFEKEAQALVDLMRSMIDAGQLDEAAQLLEQYTLLNPTDPQIAELRAAMKNGDGSSFLKNGDGSSFLPVVNRSDFLNNTESIFIVANLITKRSGFFMSIFNKIRLMEERLGYSSTILTTVHNIDLRKTEVWLKTFTGSSEIMSSKTRVLSVYEHFQNSYAEGLKNKAVYSRQGAQTGCERYEQEAEGVYNAFDGDTLIRTDFYTGYSGSLRMERFYKDGIKSREVLYDDWGYLNCIREFETRKREPDNEGKYTVKYFATDGRQCIEAEFDDKIDNIEPQKLFLCAGDGMREREIEGNTGLAAMFLSQMMSADSGKFYLLTFETGKAARISDKLDEDMNSAKVNNYAKVSVVHSIFLSDAYDKTSKPQPFYEYICNNPEKMDSIVFLTESERQDFTNMYGCDERTVVIPHPYPGDIGKTDFAQRDKKKAVVVSRFFPEKQIDLTIDIFAEVVKEVPDARLEIYGLGPGQEEIEAYISKRGMENNVFLMGYTDDAVSVYKTAALHIMTSSAEGFGLTLMESICNGCPAFALDIKYGPSDIIKNGETGFLFKRNDKKGFAEKIARYLRDEDVQREMSENCYADAPRFGQDVFLKSWLGMAERLYNNKVLCKEITGSPERPAYFDNTETIYVVQSILAKKWGFLNSVLGKIKLMEEQYGYRSALLTTTHDIDLRKKEAWLRSPGCDEELLPPGAVILNIYEYFQGTYAEGLEKKPIFFKEKKYSGSGKHGKLRFEKASGDKYTVYEGDKLIRIDIYSGSDGTLRMERHFKNGKVHKDVYFDDWGYLNCIWEYSPDDEESCTMNYFTTDGRLCITAYNENMSSSRTIRKLIVYDKDGGEEAVLKNNSELAAMYLSKVLSDASENNRYLLVLEAETRHVLAGLLCDMREYISAVAVVHSVFLNDAHDSASGPETGYVYLYYNADKFDGIVFLTQDECDDYKRICGDFGNTFVIAHPYYQKIEYADFEERDHRRAVIVSRLAEEKRIDDAIEIFAAVVKAVPDAQLEIYGTGPEQEPLKSLIKKLGMERSVFLMGYTDNPGDVYKQASLFMMTSDYEGYGLTIMESICNGCPAFSYDLKYGPADIIKDGETGFLFSPGDKKCFAEKIARYMQDEDMQRKMSGNCYADAARFSPNAFLHKWFGMVESIRN